jgi:hypothetical protein
MADEEMSRYIAVLADLVKDKKIAMSRIDRLLGWRGGVVGRLLRGERDIRLSQLLAILNILEVDPPAFFRAVYSDRSVSARLMSSLTVANPMSTPLVVPPSMTAEEFSRLIRTVLDDALAARATRADTDPPRD